VFVLDCVLIYNLMR